MSTYYFLLHVIIIILLGIIFFHENICVRVIRGMILLVSLSFIFSFIVFVFWNQLINEINFNIFTTFTSNKWSIIRLQEAATVNIFSFWAILSVRSLFPFRWSIFRLIVSFLTVAFAYYSYGIIYDSSNFINQLITLKICYLPDDVLIFFVDSKVQIYLNHFAKLDFVPETAVDLIKIKNDILSRKYEFSSIKEVDRFMDAYLKENIPVCSKTWPYTRSMPLSIVTDIVIQPFLKVLPVLLTGIILVYFFPFY